MWLVNKALSLQWHGMKMEKENTLSSGARMDILGADLQMHQNNFLHVMGKQLKNIHLS